MKSKQDESTKTWLAQSMLLDQLKKDLDGCNHHLSEQKESLGTLKEQVLVAEKNAQAKIIEIIEQCEKKIILKNYQKSLADEDMAFQAEVVLMKSKAKEELKSKKSLADLSASKRLACEVECRAAIAELEECK